MESNQVISTYMKTTARPTPSRVASIEFEDSKFPRGLLTEEIVRSGGPPMFGAAKLQN